MTTVQSAASAGSITRSFLYVGTVNVTIMLTHYVTMPILTNRLGPADYGNYNLILTIVFMFGSIARLGLDASTVRFLAAETDRSRVKVELISIALLILGSSVVLSSAIYLVLAYAPRYLNISIISAHDVVLRLIVPLLVGSELNLVILSYFRVTNNMRLFSLYKFCLSVGQMGVVVALLLSGYGIVGALVGLIGVQAALLMVAGVGSLRTFARFSVSRANLVRYVRFGAPLIPQDFLSWWIKASGLFWINVFLGAPLVGVYAVSMRVGGLFEFVTFPFLTILFPALSRLYGRDRVVAERVLDAAIHSYLMLGFFILAILTAIGPEIVILLSSQEYATSTVIVGVIAASRFMNGLFMFLAYVLLLNDKTGRYVRILLLGAVVTLASNLWLVQVVGIIGVALTGFATNGMMLGICFAQARKFQAIRIEIGKTAVMAAASAGIGLMLNGFSNQPIVLLLSAVVGAFAVYVAFLAVSGTIDYRQIVRVAKEVTTR